MFNLFCYHKIVNVGGIMKNKKGFTLVELLAVITILAIIALIAVPIITNIISSSRKSANERSAEIYVDSVNKAIVALQSATSSLNTNKIVPDGEYTIMSNGNLCNELNGTTCAGTEIEVDVDKTIPTGTVVIKNSRVVASNGTSETVLVINNETIKYDSDGKLKIDENIEIEDDDENNTEEPEPETPKVLVGDLNSDGVIDSSDSSVLAKHIASSGEYNSSMDLNCDGKIDQLDLNAIARLINGTVTDIEACTL